MDADLDTLATALYVRIDDELNTHPELGRWRPNVGLCPRISDAELLTLAVIQALLGFSSETRFLRHASAHLRHLFPYVPGQSGYNKQLRRAAGQLRAAIRLLSIETESWFVDTWLVDSTPVECGRSRETAKHSDLVGFAGYGYCASHSRYFWGLRLHLVCTPARLPVAFALANPKDDEREVLRDLLESEAGLLGQRSLGSPRFLGQPPRANLWCGDALGNLWPSTGVKGDVRIWLVAALLVVLVVVVGCGSSTPATSRPDPHERRAVAEAHALVRATPVPLRARIRQGRPPKALAHPILGIPVSNHRVDATRVWVVPAPAAATFAWITAQPPSGLTLSEGTTDGVAWSSPGTDAYVFAQLQVAVAPDGPHAAYVRADGVDLWLSTAPLRDTIGGRRLRVTLSGGCPTTVAGYADVTSPDPVLRSRLLPRAAPTGGLVCRYGTSRSGPVPRPIVHVTAPGAIRLARAVDAIPLGSSGSGATLSCPVGTNVQTLLVFGYRHLPDADLWLHTRGCRTLDNGFVRATENGTPAFYKGFVDALAAVAP